MGALDRALQKLQKKYEDPGIIMDLRNSENALSKIERVPIDSPNIGDLFGKGGYPRGRIIEIYGPFSGGKTSLATYLGATCQKTTFTFENPKMKDRKGMVLFIDAEHSLDPEFAKVHGFDIEKCILVQPDNGEQALEIVIKLVETGEIDMVIIDSIAGLTPQAEIEANMDEMQMGLQARLISKFLRKVTSILKKTKTTLIGINQIRDNIGTYGAPTTTPGGKAFKFFSSIRLETKRREWVLEGTETVGIVIQMVCTKNKTAPPRRKHLVTMSFDKGFDSHLEWIDFAIELGAITRLSKVMYANEKGEKIKSKAGVVNYYSDPENEEEYERVIAKTRELLFNKNSIDAVRVSTDSKKEEEELEKELEYLDNLVKEGIENGTLIADDGEIIDEKVDEKVNEIKKDIKLKQKDSITNNKSVKEKKEEIKDSEKTIKIENLIEEE